MVGQRAGSQSHALARWATRACGRRAMVSEHLAAIAVSGAVG